MTARTHEELDIFKLCDEIRRTVMAATATSPAAADHRFCDQIKRAAEDAVADIAEGFARFKPREFAQFLGYAIASNAEVLERTRFAHARCYFADETAAGLVVLCIRANKAMRSLRRYLWTAAPEDVPYAATIRRRRGNPQRRNG
jgi:four helix bundle protein